MHQVNFSIVEYSNFKLSRKLRFAIDDIREALRQREFWMTSGANSVDARYRRSVLGRAWITLSVAIFIVIIGGLFRNIFSSAEANYPAYLAVGYILWLFMSSAVTSGAASFMSGKSFLLQRKLPLSVFPLQMIYRDLIVMLHHIILLPPIFLFIGLWPGFMGIVVALLAFMLTFYTAFWVALFMGIMVIRFRDLQPVTASLMRMAFFATPIIWMHRDMGGFGKIILTLNPFGYFMKIVRDPLLGQPIDQTAWLVSISLAVAMTLISLIALAIAKPRLTYWL